MNQLKILLSVCAILASVPAYAGTFSLAVSPDPLSPHLDTLPIKVAAYLYNPDSCYELSGRYGANLSCNAGYIGIGACGSGKDADCQGAWERIRCCQVTDPSLLTTQSNWKSASYGVYLTCDSNQVVTGNCGSGRDADCYDDVAHHSTFHRIKCTNLHLPPSVTVNHANPRDMGNNYHGNLGCRWIPGHYGQNLDCDQNEIYAGGCGSGRDDDCGGGIWHAIECCSVSTKAVGLAQ